MTGQTAIFVPGHGAPETIRSIRFTPKLEPIGQLDPTRTSTPHTPANLEVWQGDFYGEPTKERLMASSTFDRTETVFANGEMPVVSAGKSAVVVVHNAPSGFVVEFQSEFTDQQGNIVRRTLTLDNFGTAHETRCEPKSFARRSSVALHQTGDVHRTGHLARTLRSLVDRLATSISGVFRPAPNTMQFGKRDTVPGADLGLSRPAAGAKGFTLKPSDDSRA